MTKKIAIINDLSGFGRCSLTAAISVTAAMGVQPCPLPTAILSAQTGYPSYFCDDYTDKMEAFRSEWMKMNVRFDGIYTGFVASEMQIRHIHRFIDTFCSEDTFLLVDPVMGDNGNTYAMFTEQLRCQMRELALRADIITPNLTELCLLTGTDYHTLADIKDTGHLTESIDRAGKELCKEGPGEIIVTGIRHKSENGTDMMGNLYITKEFCKLSSFPYIGGSYSGTGDLFASCLAAGIARGDSIPDIMETAGAFLELALADSVKEQVPRNDGVNYEKFLPMLLKGA
ncbi:pyridoxamine kinase [[Clostridium] hylemonae]|uniref:pyridoxamine kinase n=1 Tax=[Clostridium] hylemonae TaxID=89153 RepID=UPI001D082EB2|nr:pyridoxamine kinase [[Clostridium] hylemonae]MCB7523188.1 pyridoxamine kinase [[Clostridium] hylemonae]